MPEFHDWDLLPAHPDNCQECNVKHHPDMPHNQESLYWQYKFFKEQDRWPTWKDAMEHCSEEMKRQWIAALKCRGIEVPK